MRRDGQKAEPLSTSDAAALPWTFAQLLTHLTSTGGKVRPGDMISSGPVSGATRESGGCFLDRTAVYQSPVRLANGETRMSVEDGDEITLRGWCEREGFRRIGFGSCVGELRPALA
jgi:fumarylacetoacetase